MHRARPGDLAERARSSPRTSSSCSPTSTCASVPAATSSPSAPKRHNNARAWSATRAASVRIGLQADLRRDDNSAYGGNTTGRLGLSFEPLRGLQAAGARRHDASVRRPSTTCSIPDYGVPRRPGFAISPSAAAASRSGATWESGDTRLSVTVVPQPGPRPDRLRARLRRRLRAAGLCPPAYAFGCARNVGRARLQGVTPGGARSAGAPGRRARQRRAARCQRQRHRLAPEPPRRAPGERGGRPASEAPGTPARRSSSSARDPTAPGRPSSSAATACSTCAPPGASTPQLAARGQAAQRARPPGRAAARLPGPRSPGLARSPLRRPGPVASADDEPSRPRPDRARGRGGLRPRRARRLDRHRRRVAGDLLADPRAARARRLRCRGVAGPGRRADAAPDAQRPGRPVRARRRRRGLGRCPRHLARSPAARAARSPSGASPAGRRRAPSSRPRCCSPCWAAPRRPGLDRARGQLDGAAAGRRDDRLGLLGRSSP